MAESVLLMLSFPDLDDDDIITPRHTPYLNMCMLHKLYSVNGGDKVKELVLVLARVVVCQIIHRVVGVQCSAVLCVQYVYCVTVICRLCVQSLRSY